MIGPNGAGKTTLFNVIAGVYGPDRGRIVFEGRDVTGRRPYEVCRLGIGRTFQIVKPFVGVSVFDTVMTAAFCRTNRRREAEHRAREVLEAVGMAGKRDLLGRSLTIADRKRLELAKALASGPRLLLLDEVMAGLNPVEVQELIGMLRTIAGTGLSVVIIEHVMEAVMQLCSRAIVLNHGEVILEASPEVVAADPRVVEAYLGDRYLSA